MQQVRDDDALMSTFHSEFGHVMAPLGHVAHRVQVTSTLLQGHGHQVAATMLPDGVKALAPSGAAVVGQEFKPDPVALGQPALSLLDVIPVTAHATTEFAYLRQTVRTNNAAVVAEGAVKPTSVYTVVKSRTAWWSSPTSPRGSRGSG